MAYEHCSIVIEVRGAEETVECRKEKSEAFEYGNDTQTVFDSPSIRQMNWGRPLTVDTRYVQFGKHGGFAGFCVEYLRDYGLKVE